MSEVANGVHANGGADGLPPPESKPLTAQVLVSLKRTFDLYASGTGPERYHMDESSERIKIACKLRDDYAAVKDLPQPAPQPRRAAAEPAEGLPADFFDQGPGRDTGAPSTSGPRRAAAAAPPSADAPSALAQFIDSMPEPADKQAERAKQSQLVVARKIADGSAAHLVPTATGGQTEFRPSALVARSLASRWPKPKWHAPWKCYRVISGHLGWVRCLAFDPSNEWFVTGSADRTIKIWNTATGELRLTLTGHIEQITGLAVSARSPYMFSCGLDKMVKCWDLEYNKVIRSYHGHLSGVYSMALHPTLDLLMTGGRDSVCRVWDIRTKLQVHCLSGHDNTVASILAQPTDPQVITGSHDSTVKLWDLRKGKVMNTLTFHKKGVRAMAAHPKEFTFVSGSADNIKKFKLPEGEFLHNMLQQQRSIVNTLAVNEDGVMVSGGDNGSMWFWDYNSGNCFQQQQAVVQPGSLDAESGIFAAGFDVSGSRLVTCEADKTVKMWREDPDATPETHPIDFRPPTDMKRF